MEKQLAKQENALAVNTEQSGIMNAISKEVNLIPAVDKEFRYQLPRLGKIHLGIKVQTQSGKEYPKATEYFVLPEELLTDADFRQVLTDLGEDPDKPTKLPVVLARNDLRDNLKSSCDLYGLSKGLVCRSLDGVNAIRVNQKTGEMVEEVCKGDCCKDFQSGACHWIHRLRVVIPDAKGLGVWQIDTSSDNNRANLYTEMMQTKTWLSGKLAGIDLLLTLEPREFQIPMTDKKTGETTIRKTVACLMHLRSELSLRKLKEAALQSQEYDADSIEDFDYSEDDLPVVEEVPDETIEFDEKEEEHEEVLEGEVVPDDLTDLRLNVVEGLKNLFETNTQRNAFILSAIGTKMLTGDMSQSQLEQMKKMLAKRADILSKETE